MKHFKWTASWALISAVALGLSAAACGDNDDGDPAGDGDGDSATGDSDSATGDSDSATGDGDTTSSGDGDGDGGGSGDGDGGAGNGGAPNPVVEELFAVATQVADAEDNYTTYLVLTESLAEGELSLDDATEIAGRGIVAGVPGSKTLFVGTDNNAVVTRYELNDEGDLEETGEVDFAAAGLSAVNEYAGQFQFVSASKAYYLDGSTGQVVIWDPAAMTYSGSISLADWVFDGEILSFGAYPLRVGDSLIAFAGWRTDEGMATQPVDRVGLLVIDTVSDDAQLVTDDRCPYVRDGVLADDGYVYLATEAWGSAMHYLNDAVTAPCLLRFDPETQELDENYQVDLTTLLEADAVGSLVLGPDNQTFILGLDATDYAGPPAGRPLASSPFWKWASLTVGDEPSAEFLANDTLTGGSQLPLHFASGSYLPLLGDETTFVEFDSAGPGEAGASVIGLGFSTVQLR